MFFQPRLSMVVALLEVTQHQDCSLPLWRIWGSSQDNRVTLSMPVLVPLWKDELRTALPWLMWLHTCSLLSVTLCRKEEVHNISVYWICLGSPQMQGSQHSVCFRNGNNSNPQANSLSQSFHMFHCLFSFFLINWTIRLKRTFLFSMLPKQYLEVSSFCTCMNLI